MFFPINNEFQENWSEEFIILVISNQVFTGLKSIQRLFTFFDFFSLVFSSLEWK
jgi:hypothetical protein